MATTMSEQDSIGNEIKKIRLRAGLTQTEFAEEIGTDSTNVSRWERGDATPRKHIRAKIIAAFEDVTPQDLGLSHQAAQKYTKILGDTSKEPTPEWAEDMIDQLMARLDRQDDRIERLEHVLKRLYNRLNRM